MSPTFEIFGLELYYYSILMMLGIFIAYFHARYRVAKKGLNDERFDNIAIVAVLSGIFGARIWYVFSNFAAFDHDFLSIFKIWEGGIAIQGAIMGGALGVWLFVRKGKREMNFMDLANIILPAMLLGQVVGRWGNFFNQEVYGSTIEFETLLIYIRVCIWALMILATTLILIRQPWKKFAEATNPKMKTYEGIIYGFGLLTILFFLTTIFMGDIVTFVAEGMKIYSLNKLPLFLVESTLNLIGFALIIYVLPKIKKINKRGMQAGAYLVWYGVIRMILEPLRDSIDILYIGPIMISFVIAIVSILVGIFVIYLSIKKNEDWKEEV